MCKAHDKKEPGSHPVADTFFSYIPSVAGLIIAGEVIKDLDLFLAAEDYVRPSRFDDEHINAEGHGILAEAIYRTLMDSFLQTG